MYQWPDTGCLVEGEQIVIIENHIMCGNRCLSGEAGETRVGQRA